MVFYISLFVVFFLVLPFFNIQGYSFGFIPFFFFFPFFFGKNRSRNTNTPSDTQNQGADKMRNLDKEHTRKSWNDIGDYPGVMLGAREPNPYKWLYLIGIAIIAVGVLIIVLMFAL